MSDITYAKKTPTETVTSAASAVPTTVLVKEGVALDAKIKDADKKLKPIKKELLLRAGNYPAEVPVEFPGEGNSLAKLSKVPDVESCVDPKAVFEVMGEAFWKIANVRVGDLKDYLTLDEREKVMETKPGTRRITFKKIK